MQEKVTLLALSAFLIIAAPASAQLVIYTTNTPSVITFDADTAGIYQARTGTGTMRSIAEPDAFGLSQFNANKSSALLVGGAASAQQYTTGFTGSGNGSPTRFQADANGDGDTIDEGVGNVNIRVYRPDETLGTGLSSNAVSLSQNGDFAFNSLYFRIQNNTGATVTDWTFAADIFYAEPDANNFSNLTFSYAIDNGVDPAAMTFTGFGTAPAITQAATLASLAGALNQTITTAGVANGDYIILAFRDTAASTSGSTIFLDNIGVTAVAVPEPSTYAALLGLLALGVVAYRRRRA